MPDFIVYSSTQRSFEQLNEYEQQHFSSSTSSTSPSSLRLFRSGNYSPPSSSYLSPRHSSGSGQSPPQPTGASYLAQQHLKPPPPPPFIGDPTFRSNVYSSFSAAASVPPHLLATADLSSHYLPQQKRPLLSHFDSYYNNMEAAGGLLSSTTAANVQQQHGLMQNGTNGTPAGKFENKKAKIDTSKADNDSAFSACSSQSSGAASPHRHASPGASSPEPPTLTNGYHNNHHASNASSSMSAEASTPSTPLHNAPNPMSSSASNASIENGGTHGVQVSNNGTMRRDSSSHPSCPTEPSKVIHFRGVSPDAQPLDVQMLCMAYGEIEKCLLLKHKNQALVEFKDEQSAVRLVNAFNPPSRNECKIAGRKCYVQYSNHKEIRLNERNQNGNDMSPVLNVLGQHMANRGGYHSPYQQLNNLLAAVQQHGSPSLLSPTYAEHGRLHQQVSNGNGSAGGSSAEGTSGVGSGVGGLNTVLRVIIENVGQALSADALYPVFSKFGQVLKIITFAKEGNSQALIQFAQRESAAVCKQYLDNKLLFPGCAMRVEYSRMSNLEINRNNDRNRDYTDQPPPAAGELNTPNHRNGMQNIGSGSMQHHPASILSPSSGGNSAYHIQQVQQVAAALLGINPQLINQVLGGSGHQSSGGGYSGSPYSNGNHMNGGGGGNNALLPPAALANNLMHANLLNMAPQLLPNMSGSPAGSVGLGGSPVVHVSNLNDAKVLPETLFKLFGVYGDVQRVKIMFAKRDTALVQMADASQARNAIRHLDKARLYGRPLKLTLSNKPEVKLPQEWQDAKQDAGLTRDYNNSPLHRFKRPHSSNFRNVYPPSDTLHLSNIPGTKTEADIREAFKEAGYEAQEFRYFTNDPRMALIQFASAEEATEALIAMHNYDFKDGNYLRVSFSKSRIK